MHNHSIAHRTVLPILCPVGIDAHSHSLAGSLPQVQLGPLGAPAIANLNSRLRAATAPAQQYPGIGPENQERYIVRRALQDLYDDDSQVICLCLGAGKGRDGIGDTGHQGVRRLGFPAGDDIL